MVIKGVKARMSILSNIGMRIKAAGEVLLGGEFSSTFQLYSGGQPPTRGDSEILKAYKKMPWLRAAANKISRSIASNAWKLYVIRDNNTGKAISRKDIKRMDINGRRKELKELQQNDNLEEITDHVFLDLITSMNPLMIGLVGRQLIQIWLDLVGEAYLLVERNKLGLPGELWPLPPTAIKEIATINKPYYRISLGSWNDTIPAEDIIMFKDPDPSNPYGRGSGLAQSMGMGDELDTDEYAAKHTKSWFYNRARPDILVTSPELSPKDTVRLEEDWQRKHQGFYRAYKAHFLNKDVKVHELNQTFENMQLVELRQFERNIIIEVFGIPPEILGIIESSNRATIDAADTLYGKHVLVPRLELLREVFQVRLVDQFDNRLLLDYESPVPEDREYKKEVMNNTSWAFMIDEHREAAGKDPLPDGQGQKFMVPINLIAVDIKEYGQTQQSNLLEVNYSKQQSNQNKNDIDINLITEIISAINIDQLKGETKILYYKVLEEVGQEALDALGVDIAFNLEAPEIIFYSDEVLLEMYSNINTTTLNALKETLREGIESGEGIPSLAKRVSAVYDEAKGTRALAIARTESMRTVNYGTLQGYRQSHVVERKEWIAVPDSRVRDGHIDLDRRTRNDPIPHEANFVLKAGNNVGAMAECPGMFGIAEEDIFCRCSIAAVIGDKSSYQEQDRRDAYWKTMDKKATGYENAMKAAYIKAFQKQQLDVMDVLKNWNEGE